jgi:starch phosphorylase
MSTKTVPKRQALPDAATLINSRYGRGPVQFAGTSEALYERHLLFDSGVDLASDAGI